MEVMISSWSSNSIGDLIKSADLGHPRWSLYQVFLVLLSFEGFPNTTRAKVAQTFGSGRIIANRVEQDQEDLV